MRRRIALGLLAGAALLGVPPAQAQPTAPGSGGGAFVEVTVGPSVPLGDGYYTTLLDTSFVPTISGGWMFALGGGEASFGPEATVTYMPLTTEDWPFAGVNADIYAGRFRLAGGARFRVDLDDVYLFVHFDVGLDLVHASWTYTAGLLSYSDSEASNGVAFIPGFGFGARVLDWLGITARFDLPTAMHWDDHDGGVDYNFKSTDLELDLGVTFFI